MEQLHRACRDPRPQLLAQQRVRHRVVMLRDLDVIIEAGLALLPLGVDVAQSVMASTLAGPVPQTARDGSRRDAGRHGRSAAVTQSRIAAFNSTSEKNLMLRNL